METTRIGVTITVISWSRGEVTAINLTNILGGEENKVRKLRKDCRSSTRK